MRKLFRIIVVLLALTFLTGSFYALLFSPEIGEDGQVVVSRPELAVSLALSIGTILLFKYSKRIISFLSDFEIMATIFRISKIVLIRIFQWIGLAAGVLIILAFIPSLRSIPYYLARLILLAVPTGGVVLLEIKRKNKAKQKELRMTTRSAYQKQTIAVPEHDGFVTNESVCFAITEVDGMDGHLFEEYCAKLLRNNGFEEVSVTRGSGDQGVDIIAKKDGIKYAIQCKCYSSDLGNKPIQEVYAGKAFYKCQLAAVMTNRYFTPGGIEAAEATGVLLWDRRKLQEFIDRANKN